MIHKTAEVNSKNIGAKTRIWQFCVILEGAKIGKNCNINSHVFIENDVIVGDDVTIKSGVQLWDGLRIATGAFIGPNVTFTNDLVPRSKQYPDMLIPTIIETGASIGANSTIIAGNKIGRYALIGAGSVVSKKVPAFTVWYGNPATHRGYITRTAQIIDLQLKDKYNNSYELIRSEPILI